MGEPERLAAVVPERSGREGDQPLPVVGRGGDILAELVERLEERRSTGLRRYGQPLRAFNGRESARDLEDELLDGAAYARQVAAEMAALELAVVALAGCVEFTPVAGGPVDAAMQVAQAVEMKLARRRANGGG